MSIPDAAIEAAAEAMTKIIPNADGVIWEFTHNDGQREAVTLREAARVAIAAAMPAIREALAQEIEAP